MKVSELANLVGVTPDTVRYYTSIGLLVPAIDPDNGYRRFKDTDVHRLRFVLRARRLGFHLDEIAKIIGMSDRGRTPCPVVREIVQRRIAETRERVAEMQALQARLEQALALWAEMPNAEPDGHATCALIDATGDECQHTTDA
ncbi:MerR family DNA-binding protein [Candidatus Accumulibacter sp. ACC007]|uniref:MerR family DNA-binding protein n=1 Tax=Candidatus Accumulibacter sp. ACC007 TaxID=2823333 RepID=UPI0025C6A910|nr:MerR family DNA-binding protein [Candidatus Accumulibacter sp. ACC007]